MNRFFFPAFAAAAVVAGLLFSLPITGEWIVLVPAGILALAGFIVPSQKIPGIMPVLFFIPFIVASTSMSFWGGALVVALLTAGVILDGGDIVSYSDRIRFIFPAGAAILGYCLIIDRSNHMLLPVLVAVFGALSILGMLGILEYRAVRIYR